MTTLIENLSSEKEKKHLIIHKFLTFLISTLYSYLLIISSKSFDNFITIGFVVFLVISSYIIFKNIKEINVFDLIQYLCFLHLGIILGFYFGGNPIEELWLVDARTMHAPSAINISNFLSGAEDIRKAYSEFDKTYFINIYVGIWFFIFTASPIVSSSALMSIKALSVYNLFKFVKRVYNEEVAKISCIIFIFTPTLLFYTITYYKEAGVQLFIILFCSYLFNISKKGNYKDYIFLTISILYFANERFYLVPILLGTFLLVLFFKKSVSPKFKFFIFISSVLGLLLFYLNYSKQIPIDKILLVIDRFRNGYNSYSDVNPKYNISLFYPFAIIKFLFTPFFTINKFKIFHNYSYLLIWGSFINQIIIFSGVTFIFQRLKILMRSQWFFLLPFVFFILFFAYISPYNGRLRDIFYPLISMWAAAQIHQLFSRVKPVND